VLGSANSALRMIGIVVPRQRLIRISKGRILTLDFAEKPASAELPWRGVACGSQRRLRRLKALQAAPLQSAPPSF
jgi:hypothetical protein